MILRALVVILRALEMILRALVVILRALVMVLRALEVILRTLVMVLRCAITPRPRKKSANGANGHGLHGGRF